MWNMSDPVIDLTDERVWTSDDELGDAPDIGDTPDQTGGKGAL